MKKLIYLTLGVISLIVISLMIIIFLKNNSENPKVCIEDICFNVEIADSPNEQKIGLMYRDKLDLNEGMLFIYPKAEPRYFWMKNTLIPLDIIWINNEKIIYISEDTPPCTKDPCNVYGSNIPAQYIIEINSSYSFDIGDKVNINI